MANRPNNNAPMGPPDKVKITAAAFASKYKSKREVYNFLAVDVGIYLPAFGKCSNTLSLTLLFPSYRTSDHLLSQRLGLRGEEE